MELNKILQNNEFSVRYQPQINADTGEIVGAEALVRIRKSDGIMISPLVFIPSMEKEGKIAELDRQVLKIVCSDIMEAGFGGIKMPPVTVNISRINMGFPETAEKLKAIADSFSVDREQLVFELTESGVYKDKRNELSELMGKLQEMGFKISLDDYGTGFSSLKMMADVNFDILKLDRYFVSQIGSPRIDKILRSVIEMSERLGASPIAEGVENVSQLDFLRKNGCKYMQGYYFYRPLSKQEFLKKLLNSRKDIPV